MASMGLPGLLREHEVAVLSGGAQPQTLLGLPRAMAAQCRDSGWRKAHPPARLLRLRLHYNEASADALQAAADLDRAILKANIPPLQSQQLTFPHARGDREPGSIAEINYFDSAGSISG